MDRILITGTNRGLGRQLIKHLAIKNIDIHLVVTVRKQPKEYEQKLLQQYPKCNITCLQLDITNNQNITHFIDIISEKKWKFDAIVNNAAVGADLGAQIPSIDVAKKTFQCNTIGTITFTKKILKFLSNNGRIINVSSKIAGLIYQGQQIRKKLNDPNITQENIYQYIQQYIHGCQIKQLNGWFQSAYGTSKALLNSWSRFILQKQLKQNQRIICMSPGSCQTDMGPPNPVNTAEKGAQFIYNCLWIDSKKECFYHSNLEYDYIYCGTYP